MTASVSIPWPPEHLRNFRSKPSYRFAVLDWGTRGDVQPFAAIGAELVRRGHQVVIAAREPFRALIEEHGIEFYAMPEDGTDDLMRALAVCKSMPEMLQISASYSRSLVRPQLESFWDGSRGADVILTKAITTAPAMHVAERRGLPVFLAHFDLGFIPTEYYCFAGDSIRDRGKRINRFMPGFLLTGLGISLTDRINAWRKEQRMPVDWFAKRNRSSYLSRFPAFAVWSPHFLMRPPDWPERVVQTGWWRLPRKKPVSQRLREFTEEGAPPVYIGFGSWGVHDKTAVTEVLLETLRVTGNRGILLRNTVDDRKEFPENILVEEELPYDWLFPRIKAAVHHGGAGTVGAVTSAGIPSVIIPAFPAQAAWGHLIAEKNIGTMLEKREFGVERLAAALREIDRPDVRERASALGGKVRGDRCEEQAADEIERRLAEIAGEPGGPTVWPVPELFRKAEQKVPVQ
jgi:sterol 3beta-glucosyltransferase